MKDQFIFSSLVLILILAAFAVQAQTDISADIPTRKINKSVKENKKSNFPEEKKIRYLYKKDVKNLLYGNPCAIEITRNMGFEYSLKDRPANTFRTELKRNWHNLGVKSMMILKNGIWWKSTVNKHLKKCVQYSGDRMG